MMINRLLDRWRRLPPNAAELTTPAPPAAPDPQPDRPLAVIGDVHGRLDLLELLIDHLLRDPDLSEDTELILAGDLIDRGPDSAGVIDLVRDLQAAQPERVIALSGNHEAMLLEFLDGGRRAGLWLRAGGDATLASFGLPTATPTITDTQTLTELRMAATEAIGEDRIAWLRALPLAHQSGTVVVVHAAFDRKRPLSAQSPERMLWGSRNFYASYSTALPWVVHGHVVTRPPQVEGSRIAIDSGAWMGGGLSAAVILPGVAPRLVTVHG